MCRDCKLPDVYDIPICPSDIFPIIGEEKIKGWGISLPATPPSYVKASTDRLPAFNISPSGYATFPAIGEENPGSFFNSFTFLITASIRPSRFVATS